MLVALIDRWFAGKGTGKGTGKGQAGRRTLAFFCCLLG